MRNDYDPLRTAHMDGRAALVPRDPEVVLEERYGGGWRTSDQGLRDWPPRARRRRMRAGPV